MKLFIPPIGTILVLSEDWTFDLYQESRKIVFIDRLIDAGFQIIKQRTNWDNRSPRIGVFTLPANTILKVSRIYIRLGQRGFDSITFNASFIHNNKKIAGRFWVKLEDANRIVYNLS